MRPCYGPLFPARAKRAPPSAARASRARNKGTVTWAQTPGKWTRVARQPLLATRAKLSFLALPGYLRVCCFGKRREDQPRSPASFLESASNIVRRAHPPAIFKSWGGSGNVRQVKCARCTSADLPGCAAPLYVSLCRLITYWPARSICISEIRSRRASPVNVSLRLTTKSGDPRQVQTADPFNI